MPSKRGKLCQQGVLSRYLGTTQSVVGGHFVLDSGKFWIHRHAQLVENSPAAQIPCAKSVVAGDLGEKSWGSLRGSSRQWRLTGRRDCKHSMKHMERVFVVLIPSHLKRLGQDQMLTSECRP
jgi:hypothetical protein